jgi:hypothetical protein
MYIPELRYKSFDYPTELVDKFEEIDIDDTVYVQDWGKHVIHSVNCVDLINCTCTPIDVSTKLEEKRKQWWEDNREAMKSRERLRRKQGSNGQPQRDHFDPTIPKEEFGE